jgi:hypothetical protein
MLQCSVAGCTRIGIMKDGASAPLCWVHQTVKPSREDKLIAFAKFEQMYLWDDLYKAIRLSSNGVWSTGADVILWRLLRCLQVVWAVDHDQVPWELLGSDIWSTILDLAHIPHTDFTEEQWGWYEQRLKTFGGTRAELLAKYAETRATLHGLSIWEPYDGETYGA